VTIKSQCHAYKLINQELCGDEHIDKLHKGDMFGEIGLLTSIRRTCTVETTDSCLMIKLNEDGLKNIQKNFPSISENITDSISNYFDRDTC
jgi:CRP-like cAMP-binding protein